jgi:tellurite methyltransferase
MNEELRSRWEQRHREQRIGSPEPFILEMLPLLPRGRALDVAAGTGRNSILLARAGFHVHALDFSFSGLRRLSETAKKDSLPIDCTVVDFDDFSIPERHFDLIVDINFLDRKLIPGLKQGLRIGGALLFDTFLIDQAEIGHPNNPDFLLRHYELRELLDGLELLRYQERFSVSPWGVKSWRAGAVALRRS